MTKKEVIQTLIDDYTKQAKLSKREQTIFEHGLLTGIQIGSTEKPEVDLEKEVKDYIYTLPHSRTGIPGGWKCSWNEEEVIKIVKHFLEVKQTKVCIQYK